MKRCLILSLVAGLVLAGAGLLWAGEADDALKASRAVQKQIKEVEAGKAKATLPSTRKQTLLRQVRDVLMAKPADQAQTQGWERALADAQVQLEFAQARVAQAEASLAAAKISDPEKRQAKLKETEEQLRLAQEDAVKAAQPFDEQEKAIMEKVPDQTAVLKKSFEAAFRDGGGDLPNLKHTAVSGDFYHENWHVAWQTKDGTQRAWCQLATRLRDLKVRDAKKLDGKYPILSSFGDNGILVQVGGIELQFQVSDPGLFKDAKAPEVLKDLVDLDALAKLGQ